MKKRNLLIILAVILFLILLLLLALFSGPEMVFGAIAAAALGYAFFVENPASEEGEAANRSENGE